MTRARSSTAPARIDSTTTISDTAAILVGKLLLTLIDFKVDLPLVMK